MGDKVRMDMQDPAWVAELVLWGWALSYFLWLVFKGKMTLREAV
jgi:hypothetical protein